jgi:hypothetical protein
MSKPFALIAGTAIAVITLASPQSHADSHAAFFAGAGATGTNAAGFRGGWGFSGGVEIPVARNADLVLRGDYHAVPAEAGGGVAIPVDGPIHILSDFAPLGSWPDGAARVDRIAVFSGLRLHPPRGAVRSYLDLLVGVGNIQDGTQDATVRTAGNHDDTNVALSFGGGLVFPSPLPGSMFLDAHYDFYFVGRDVTPIIPVKLGMRVP